MAANVKRKQKRRRKGGRKTGTQQNKKGNPKRGIQRKIKKHKRGPRASPLLGSKKKQNRAHQGTKGSHPSQTNPGPSTHHVCFHVEAERHTKLATGDKARHQN